MKTPGIYIIRIMIADAFYVGHSANTGQRFRQHRNRLQAETHSNPILQAAWRKYGKDEFAFRHLWSVADHATRVRLEICLIAKLRAAGRKVYNIGDGGEGQAHTPESCAKISAAHMGKVFSEESRQKMSVAQKGHPSHPNAIAAMSKYWKGRKRGPMSEETKHKVSIAKKGTPSHPWTEASKEKLRSSLKGKKPSNETRHKMSEARKAAIARGQRSRVKMVSYNGKTLCLTDWARLVGIDRRLLAYRLRHWPIADAMTRPADQSKRYSH